MTEKLDPVEDNNKSAFQNVDGNEKKSAGISLEAKGNSRHAPSYNIRESNFKLLQALDKNPFGFLYALGFLLLNVISWIFIYIGTKGISGVSASLITASFRIFAIFLVVLDLSGLIYWITYLIYKNKSKKGMEDDSDFQILHGHKRLDVITEQQKKFTSFYSKLGTRKLNNILRVEKITILMLEAGKFRQIEKDVLKNHLHHYRTSLVFQDSRDGMYIETLEDIDASHIYAIQTVHREQKRSRNRNNSINLLLDERPVRGGSKKMWWDYPYDKVLENIVLITNTSSLSRVISQLLNAYRMDKKNRLVALQLAYKIAFSGAAVENKILKELFDTIAKDRLEIREE